ncbi:hypothetical protein GWK47_038662 [Chionoecetes opilio]|uniref:Uncharacterized protein n=1 Tax=Chionoecetes opilio TaxID=41210 RepID=A0A8J5D0S7_CHIOP|nr:hypothetical protein GWK47_038662 [Chionoecetes opilio]
MWVSWWLLACLLGVAVRPSTSTTQCPWEPLKTETFSKVPQTIKIKASSSANGKLTVTIVYQDEEEIPHEEDILDRGPYNLLLSCKDNSCRYDLSQDNIKVVNISKLATDFKKFIVTGDNLHWLRNCVETSDGAVNGDNASQAKEEEDKSDKQDPDSDPEVWVLVLVAVGVAVTVVAMGILAWSIYTMFRKNDTH